MKYKYLILDFGNVIITPTTGHFDMTPKFLELVDVNKIDNNLFIETRKKYQHILSEKINTLEEEFNMFFRFYDGILSEIYPNYDKSISEKIAFDRTYNTTKYTLCDQIYEELNILKEKYKLILLTDNWPCVVPYLKEYNLYDYFDKIYVSSVYGSEKKDKVFFDYPINDFNIKNGEALFIDDNEQYLDIAKEKGIDVLLMDRFNTVEKSRYRIIHNLFDLECDYKNIDKLYNILLSDKPSIELKNNEKALFELIPELSICKGFNQNNEWHIYDIYEHILHVVDYVPNILSLRLAALFHDVGKPKTYKEDENGVGHFYGHWEVSQKIFDDFSVKYGIDKELSNFVSKLIYYHDIGINRLNDLEKEELYNQFGESGIELLFEFKKADLLAQNEKYHYVLDEYVQQKAKLLKK